MAKWSQWQSEYSDEVKKMSNSEMFEALLEDAGGDDYEGGFTTRGYWKFQYLTEEFRGRLIEAGFLPSERR